MPNTYTLISSNTLSSSAASVTFSAIPNTYTDLVLRMSVRSDNGATFENPRVFLNGDTANNYSYINLLSDGTGPTSGAGSNSGNGVFLIREGTGNTATSNTFSNTEIYIPNYLSTTSKQICSFGVSENNATQGWIATASHLYRNSTSITLMSVNPQQGTVWLTGSSFYLYGIAKS
jgi:hypothetical protein